ncbi:ATP-dependent RecD-like DNA helicase, partial [Bacteroidota bacterium]
NVTSEFSEFGSGHLLDDLISYVYNGKNCKLILLGDTAQLPPVGLTIGCALNAGQLEVYGKKVYEVYLKEVVRHSANSGILINATGIRNNIANKNIQIPKIKQNNYTDIQRLNGSELPEELSSAFDKYGIDNCMLICRSNKQTNQYNKGIRNRILWRENEICAGDRLMVVKNNYFWMRDVPEMDFIANGDIAEILRINKYEEIYNYRFADVTLKFIDYKDLEIDAKINLSNLFINSASMSYEDSKAFYQSVAEDYYEIKSKRKRFEKIRENPFFNSLQVKFAYAVTCHKAQGGQWKVVFVDQGYLPDNFPDIDYLRWFYTAVTRATEKLYLVNFKDEFFE